MKREPIKGREYIGKDDSYPGGFRGRYCDAYGSTVVIYQLKDREGRTASFSLDELSIPPERRISRKSPPTPPKKWEYDPIDAHLTIRNNRGEKAGLWGTGKVFSNTMLFPNEHVAVAKFLRRLARWHARRAAK